MSLQGSLETFALPDVLALLSSTRKDGELQVTGDSTDGRVWFEAGAIVHTAVAGRPVPSVDTLFELLRLAEGDFTFSTGGTPPARSEPEAVDTVLLDAQIRLEEWGEIVAVVPHLDCQIDMAGEAPDETVTITAGQWRLLRAVAGGRSVHELMACLHLGEFETCKQVKQLVEAHLAGIDVAAEAPIEATAPTPAELVALPTIGAGDAGADPGLSSGDADELEALAELAGHPANLPWEARHPAHQPWDPDDAEIRHPDAWTDEEVDAAEARVTGDGDGLPSEDTGPAEEAPADPDDLDDLDDVDDVDAPADDERPAGDEEPPLDEVHDEAKALVAQLAALADEDEDVAQQVAEHLASGGELPATVSDGDEPINRGLLLKFLSSVRG